MINQSDLDMMQALNSRDDQEDAGLDDSRNFQRLRQLTGSNLPPGYDRSGWDGCGHRSLEI